MTEGAILYDSETAMRKTFDLARVSKRAAIEMYI